MNVTEQGWTDSRILQCNVGFFLSKVNLASYADWNATTVILLFAFLAFIAKKEIAFTFDVLDLQDWEKYV